MVDGIDPSVRLEVPESSLYQVLSFRIDQMEDGARQLPGLGAVKKRSSRLEPLGRVTKRFCKDGMGQRV
jgi:hypothetical protein